jgi:hypothetical protein
MSDSFDQLLNSTDLSTANDNGTMLKRLRRATDEESLRTRVGPLFMAWIESLKSLWGLEFDDEQLKKLVEGTVKFMEQRRLSLLSPKSFDAARVYFTRVGLLPEGLLTPDEQLIEKLNATGEMGFAARQEFIAESRRIREGL